MKEKKKKRTEERERQKRKRGNNTVLSVFGNMYNYERTENLNLI